MSVEIEVRFTDIDSQNHANHTSIVEWIAHKRVIMIEEKLVESGAVDLDYVLANLNVSFPKEVLWPGTVVVEGRITKFGTKSLTSEYTVTQNGEVVATATCVNVFFTPSTKVTTAIPTDLKQRLVLLV